MSTKTQQLDFQNFHCFIVCSYCSIVCLITKVGQKMFEDANTSYENEIQRVDSPSNNYFKIIIFCQGGPNFWGRNSQKISKQGNLLLCKLGSAQF